MFKNQVKVGLGKWGYGAIIIFQVSLVWLMKYVVLDRRVLFSYSTEG
jgi:hypothetical protein